ncbi:hypothetical protein BDFB_014114 [Asbolus verrucosus]|uniref:7tm 7 domain containing protein n=1 Tax=Asbolus verrucosus TaxID=1661398 RepID=A0A482W6S2_ASBVE|nr:hypothetical protein BDFB_014114 [Asbolus verrucosus]
MLSCLFLFQLLCEVNFYAKFNAYINIFLIPTFINIFIILISILNMNHFANGLRNMLFVFRIKLKEEKVKLNNVNRDTNPYIISRVFAEISEADDHFKYFVNICNKMESFNKIYGLQILNFTAVHLIFAYENLNLAFKEVFKTHHDHSSKYLEIIIIKMLKCFNFMVFGILLATPCFQFNLEMDKVAVLCRKILIDLPETMDNTFSRYLKLKLIFLLKQLEIRKPYFTAAGFFEVNYVMLIYILNGITSYLMVTLQAT